MKASELSSTISVLQQGGIGILPTDTLYGIVGSALKRKTVERIYKLRRRNSKKPMIVLVGALADLKKFGVVLSTVHRKLLTRLWPGKVSIILPCASKKFAYLHRGTKTLAFRYPKSKWLQNLLKKTGPLVAPSANWEGRPPAKTIAGAKKYFGPVRSRARAQARPRGASGRATSNGMDFYINRGRLNSKPSTLVALRDGKVEILRQGAVKIHS